MCSEGSDTSGDLVRIVGGFVDDLGQPLRPEAYPNSDRHRETGTHPDPKLEVGTNVR